MVSTWTHGIDLDSWYRGLKEQTWTYGIDMDSWYRGLKVQSWIYCIDMDSWFRHGSWYRYGLMVLTKTHGIDIDS